MRVTQTLDSASTQQGASFSGVTSQDVLVDGLVAIPAGSAVSGTVRRRPGSRSLQGLLAPHRLAQHGSPPRESISIATDPYSVKGKGRGENTAIRTGGGAAVGAVLGGIFGGGKGAAIGAGAGGGLGAGSSAVTPGASRSRSPQSPSSSSISPTPSPSASAPTPGARDGNGDPNLQRPQQHQSQQSVTPRQHPHNPQQTPARVKPHAGRSASCRLRLNAAPHARAAPVRIPSARSPPVPMPAPPDQASPPAPSPLQPSPNRPRSASSPSPCTLICPTSLITAPGPTASSGCTRPPLKPTSRCSASSIAWSATASLSAATSISPPSSSSSSPTPSFSPTSPTTSPAKSSPAREDEAFFVQSGEPHYAEIARFWHRFFTTPLKISSPADVTSSPPSKPCRTAARSKSSPAPPPTATSPCSAPMKVSVPRSAPPSPPTPATSAPRPRHLVAGVRLPPRRPPGSSPSPTPTPPPPPRPSHASP